MVFDNTASDVSTFSKIPRGEWYLENFEILQDGMISKFHTQVMSGFYFMAKSSGRYITRSDWLKAKSEHGITQP